MEKCIKRATCLFFGWRNFIRMSPKHSLWERTFKSTNMKQQVISFLILLTIAGACSKEINKTTNTNPLANTTWEYKSPSGVNQGYIISYFDVTWLYYANMFTVNSTINGRYMVVQDSLYHVSDKIVLNNGVPTYDPTIYRRHFYISNDSLYIDHKFEGVRKY